MSEYTEKTDKREHVLACLSSSTSNAKVIHAAAKINAAFGGKLTALFVETPESASMSDADKKRLRNNMNLAEKLGAHIDTVIGDDVPFQISEYARLSDVSCIVIGQTNTIKGIFRRASSFTDRLVAYAPDLDYFIIPDHGTKAYIAKKANEDIRGTFLHDTAIFFGALAASTLLGFLFFHLGFTDANIIMVYLLGLLLVSIATNHRAFSMVWAIVNVLLFDLLFTTPRFTFYAYGTGYPVTFLVMLAAAFTISSLANQLKQNARQASKSSQRMSVVLETDRQLAKATSPKEIMAVMAQQLSKLLDRSLVIYPAEGNNLATPSFYPAANDTIPYQASEENKAVQWVFQEHKRAGATTEVYPNTDYLYYAMRVQENIYGVVGIAVHGSPLDASEQSVLASVVGECSLALENARNAKEKEESAMLAENERLRANLLRAVSHDLRTPLTSIMVSADNLLNSAETLDNNTRHQLYSDIYTDAQWLRGMVENLLSASRMTDGKLNLNMAVELMDDMVNEAIQHMGRRLDAYRIERNKPDQLLFVKVDARLIIQVMINLLDNAIKYAPEGSTIWIDTFEQDNEVHVRVADNGPGIPDDKKPRIFEMFFTGNPAGDNRRGLGVGLALCQSILKAHAGKIWVTDHEPQGAQFEFTLPKQEVIVDE